MSTEKARFEVRHTGSPDGNRWKTLEVFSTLAEADAKVAELKREMHAICGPNAWDDQFQVISTADVEYTVTRFCHGKQHILPFEGTATAIWHAGETRPSGLIPDGWASSTMCGNCGRQYSEALNAFIRDEEAKALNAIRE